MTEISSLLYHLKITEQKMSQLFEKRLKISLTRYELLQTLLKQSPCSQITLQDTLKIDQSAITRHLRQLEEAGYICRHRNPLNQREVLVELSQKARLELVEAPSQYHLHVKEQMAMILNEAETKDLQSLLTKIQTGLEAIQIEE